MFDIDPRQLTVAGWLLTIAALATMVLVMFPIGVWIFRWGDPEVLETLDRLVYAFIAAPGLGAAHLVLKFGRRYLRHVGIAAIRQDDSDATE